VWPSFACTWSLPAPASITSPHSGVPSITSAFAVPWMTQLPVTGAEPTTIALCPGQPGRGPEYAIVPSRETAAPSPETGCSNTERPLKAVRVTPPRQA
jgi:hypothetical protein